MKLSSISKLAFVLTIIITFGYTLMASRQTLDNNMPIDLILSFPISYWIGLIACSLLLAFCIFKRDRLDVPTVVFSLVFCLMFTQLILCFIEKNPRFQDAYLHMGSVRNVLWHARVVQATNAYSAEATLNYANFPGFFVLGAVFLSVTGLQPFFVMKYYPIFLTLILAILLYVIGRRFVRSTKCSVLALFFYFSFAWFGEFHFSPQSLGLVLYLLIIYMVISGSGVRSNVLTLVMMFALMISHPTSSVFLLLFLALELFRKREARQTLLFSTFLGMLLAWSVFVSYDLLNSVILDIYGRLQQGLSLGSIFTQFYAHGSSSLTLYQSTINNLRTAMFLLPWIVAGIVFATTIWHHRKDSSLGKLFPNQLILWIASCSIFSVFILIGGYGLFERIGLFGFVPIAVLTIYGVVKYPTSKYVAYGMLLTLVISATLLPIAKYGNESYEYVPTWDTKAENFAVLAVHNETIVGYYPTIKYFGPELGSNNDSVIDIRSSWEGTVLVFTSVYRNLFIYRLGNYTVENQINEFSFSTNEDRIYDNAFSIIFRQLK